MVSNTLLIPEVISSLFWLVSLITFLKPEFLVKLQTKYFRWLLQYYGFEGEIKSTLKTKVMCRMYSSLILLFFSFMLYLSFSGKLR
jgi:hypothetical protein